MDTLHQQVWMLVLEDGTCPTERWLRFEIKDTITRARIARQIDKLQRGVAGDWKRVGDRVFELRLDFGPGYRVYFALARLEDIVVILGGDKRTQQADIRRSQVLWDTFLKAGAPAERLKEWGERENDRGNDETEELR